MWTAKRNVERHVVAHTVRAFSKWKLHKNQSPDVTCILTLERTHAPDHRHTSHDLMANLKWFIYVNADIGSQAGLFDSGLFAMHLFRGDRRPKYSNANYTVNCMHTHIRLIWAGVRAQHDYSRWSGVWCVCVWISSSSMWSTVCEKRHEKSKSKIMICIYIVFVLI